MALLLTVLDTSCSIDDLLSVLRSAFDTKNKTLAIGPYVYQLHSRTFKALNTLNSSLKHSGDVSSFFLGVSGADESRMKLLRFRFGELLWKAGLQSTPTHFLHCLALTGEAEPKTIDRLKILNSRSKPARTNDGDDPKNWTLYKLLEIYQPKRLSLGGNVAMPNGDCSSADEPLARACCLSSRPER